MNPQPFATLVSEIARALTRLERDKVCCGDLTLQQFEALRTIQATGSRTVGEAATALGIDISTASRNLALLTRDGYVKRRRSDKDARHVVFALTKKGTACVTTLCCDERLVFAEVLARIPATERGAVLHALQVLATALADPDEESACCPPGRCTPSEENLR